jgi:hypothetical protein
MKMVTVSLSGAKFDGILANSLKEGRDLEIVIKDAATEGGMPAAMVCFSVQLPDGRIMMAQAVTTLRALGFALAACKGHYSRITGEEL